MGRDVQQTAETVGDVLQHIIQPRRAHGVLDTPFTLRIVGGQQTDRRQLNYTELGMWRNFTHCGVLYAHVPEVDPLASPPAPRDAAGPTAEPATAADPDMSAEKRCAPASRPPTSRRKNELIDHIRSHADAIGFPGELGVSRAVNGICLRVLTTRGNDAFDLIKDVSDFVVA